jgi:demethylmenaquinone methyltransferase/2-methoxy-6-polyprenyl-1,4-benzoquinol methylase
MVPLRDLDLRAHLADPALKPKFVTPMFDLVAPRYDDFTRLFSFGMDRAWKGELLDAAFAARPDPTDALDLACGTGDLAIAVARRTPAARVLGVDASREMLAFAAARITAEGNAIAARTAAVYGDLGSIPAPDHSADLITAGYAFRNGPPIAAALAEARRVLRPGGVLAVLDFYRPASVIWRVLFLGYLRAAGNIVGWSWHRQPVAYGYIASSVEAFVSAEEFSAALTSSGFELISVRRKILGGIAIHVARLPE